MRIYLYILSGIAFSLIGWNIGQIFLSDFGLLKQFPELILFPCIAVSLAVGMVLTEIFISNPTRPKLCWRKAKIPILIATGLGIFAGLISGSISQIILLPQVKIDPRILRVICWLLIGIATGIAEAISWRWQSIEAGDPKRFWGRFQASILAGIGGSLAAALIFELIRQSTNLMESEFFKDWEDPLGFGVLGILLGFVFSFSSSPSYLAALRAGTGFEYTGEKYDDDFNQSNTLPDYPLIDKHSTELKLKFVSNSEGDKIEEGLSIQLPGAGIIRIGSDPQAHIRIPGLPLHSADLEIKGREAIFKPNAQFFHKIEINGDQLKSRDKISLKHNNVITFYPKEEVGPNEEAKFYRFIFYNRFLDPLA